MLCCRDTDESKTLITDNKLTIYYDDGAKPENETFDYDELVKILENSDSYDI